ncbi:MAG TPA: hypothetical protein VFW52_02360 [Candidatus Saccharimonadales bacterium]|nr:hypothetical protein [Candidatus Saccharimonadales bacterium]
MAKNRPRRGSPLHLTPSFELFGRSKDIVIKNIWIFGPLYILPTIFMIHSWIWTPDKPGAPQHWWYSLDSIGPGASASPIPFFSGYTLLGFSLLWGLLVLVGGAIVQIMTQAAQLEGAEGKTVTFDSIWKITKELGWRMVGLYIVLVLTLFIGFLLLIIPFFIFLRRYFLSPYVMLDKKVSIQEAMSRSAAMSKPHSGSVWGVIGVIFLIGLAGVIPFIGWLISYVLGFFYSVAPALRYQELKKLGN